MFPGAGFDLDAWLLSVPVLEALFQSKDARDCEGSINRLITHKREIHERVVGSTNASFMESVALSSAWLARPNCLARLIDDLGLDAPSARKSAAERPVGPAPTIRG